MLIRMELLERIRAGQVRVAYRRWAVPRVRVGTRMRTAVGLVEVTAVERVDPETLTEADARAAGAPDLATLRSAGGGRAGEPLWRIGLHFAGDDPRVALRDNVDEGELAAVARRLRQIDARSPRGAWTMSVLELIERRPGERAADLAAELGRERLPFKADVRRLKELGLTESLEVGYRLSPRGVRLLEAQRQASRGQ